MRCARRTCSVTCGSGACSPTSRRASTLGQGSATRSSTLHPVLETASCAQHCIVFSKLHLAPGSPGIRTRRGDLVPGHAQRSARKQHAR
eukprot:992067-Rhodomonas_salina.1